MRFGILALVFSGAVLLMACVDNSDPTIVKSGGAELNTNIPSSLVDLGFVFTTNAKNDQLAQHVVAKTNSQVTYRFGEMGQLVIQQDGHSIWDINASYLFTIGIDNTATLEVTLKTGEIFVISLEFSSKIGHGSWSIDNGVDAAGGSLADSTGQFSFTSISTVESYQYRGEIKTKKTFYSQSTTFQYPYQVYLPPGYDPELSYPIIYATDGQWVFWDFSKTIDKQNKQIILVAMDQGLEKENSPNGNNRREIDYLLPGSTLFVATFIDDFIPFIESQYNLNVTSRTIQGASYGGLLVSHFFTVMDVNSPTFVNFLSADGSYWSGETRYQTLESNNLNIGDYSGINLHLSSATIEGNHQYVVAYQSRIAAYQLQGLNISFTPFDVTHVEVALPAFEHALALYFD